MSKALKDRVRQVRIHTGPEVNRYYMRFDSGWAIFYLDHCGALTITSDWGSWSHVWGGNAKTWGYPTFLDFVKTRNNCHYLADKLSYGRTRQVPDAEKTKKNLLVAATGELRPDDVYDYEQLLSEIDGFCSALDHNGMAAAFYLSTPIMGRVFPELHEWVEMTTAPKVVFLLEQLLPAFLALLREELPPEVERIEHLQEEIP